MRCLLCPSEQPMESPYFHSIISACPWMYTSASQSSRRRSRKQWNPMNDSPCSPCRHTGVCTERHTCIHARMCTHMHREHVHAHRCMYFYVYLDTGTHGAQCTYILTHVYTHAHTCIYICIHTCTHPLCCTVTIYEVF